MPPTSASPAGDDSLTVTLGQRFDVRLPANPTTGYSWALESPVAEAVRPVGHSFEPSDQARPGSTGTQVFSFVAGRSGQARLTFGYRRPWEVGVDPLQLRSVTVVVEEGLAEGPSQPG